MMENVLLISEEEIKSNSIVGNNVDGAYIRSSIDYVQDELLYNILGSQLYNKLIRLVKSNAIENEENIYYKVLVDEYIHKFMKWQVLSSLILPLNYKFRNAGLVNNNDTQHYRVSSLEEATVISDTYAKYAADYSLRMTKFIWANKDKYPEYCKCKDCSDTRPDRFAGYRTKINI